MCQHMLHSTPIPAMCSWPDCHTVRFSARLFRVDRLSSKEFIYLLLSQSIVKSLRNDNDLEELISMLRPLIFPITLLKLSDKFKKNVFYKI